MKKFIQKLLIFVMIISSLPIMSGYAAPKSGDIEFKEDVLKGLGLINESVNRDAVVLRGEWAVTLYNISNYANGTEAPEGGKQIFADVDEYHYLNGYLERLYNAGIISGNEDGRFNSDSALRGIDAYATLLRVGGYSAYMESYSDYANGILAAARTAGMKTTAIEQSEITYKEIIPVLYDSLFMKVLSPSLKITTDGNSYKPSGELVEEVMKLRYTDGCLTGVGKESIAVGDTAENGIVIDGNLYETAFEVKTVKKLLGMRVLCFINDDDEAVALVSYPNESVTIYSDDIVWGFDDNTYTVRVNDKKKKMNMEDGFYVMYNGRHPSGIVNMVPAYGSVRLVDNDLDGRYEFADITESDILYINSVNTEKKEIYAEDVNKAGRVIKLADYDEAMIFAEGMEIDISDISEGSIILCSMSDDNALANIELLKEKVYGVIKSNSADGIRVDDTEYEPAGQLYTESAIEVGLEAELTLDASGRVVAAVVLEKKGQQAIYIMNVLYDDDIQAVQIKALNESGSVKKYYCAEKVRLDGDLIKEGESVANELRVQNGSKMETVQQLVLVELNNDGKIKMIDRADAWNAPTTTGNSLRKRSVSSKVYKFFGSFNNEILIDNSTKIFAVPSAGGDDAEYSVRGKGNLTNDRGYSFEQYRTSDDVIAYEKYIVMKDQNFSGSGASRDILITKIIPSLNSDDELVDVVEGMQGVEKVSFETDGRYTLSNKGIAAGDVISPSFDSLGRIKDARLEYKYGDDSVKNQYPFNDGYRVLGYANDVKDNTIFIGKESGEQADLLYSDTRVKMVVVYDVPEKKAYAGSLSEAKTYKSVGGTCSKVYVQTIGGEPYFIVIYNE